MPPSAKYEAYLRPVLDRLSRALASTRYFAILTDGNGVVIDAHGPIDHAQVGQAHAVGAVVHVRHRGQHAGELGQAQLHVLADVATHVQARVAAQQVPAVVDAVGLGDLHVAPAAAGLAGPPGLEPRRPRSPRTPNLPSRGAE